jgi:hypothetical protein
LFSFIARNWRGQPLVSRQAIVSLIGATTSTAGLKVYAQLDENVYERAIKIPDAQLAAVNLTPDEFHLKLRRVALLARRVDVGNQPPIDQRDTRRASAPASTPAGAWSAATTTQAPPAPCGDALHDARPTHAATSPRACDHDGSARTVPLWIPLPASPRSALQ